MVNMSHELCNFQSWAYLHVSLSPTGLIELNENYL